ncbi:MAG: biopolymer transporter ExbD [Myxococcaceae bacterium]|nr:biopolymer transporter ExbD [Myxococcaceae bacterium]
MAGGMDLGTGRGGKKPLDTTINLVPFIDLMAVTIVFLIMTAVWTQLGRLNVSQEGSSPEPPASPSTPAPSILISDTALTLSVGGLRFDPIPLTRDGQGRVDLAKLLEHLGRVKTEQPEQGAITLRTEDDVAYEDLVRVIDACVGASFSSVSVTPASG